MLFAETLTVPDWLVPGLILTIIGGGLTLVVRAVFKSFRDWIKDWFEDILAEIKPNGGNTNKLGDLVLQHGEAMSRIEDGVAGIYPRMDEIETEQTRVRTELLAIRECSARNEDCPLRRTVADPAL